MCVMSVWWMGGLLSVPCVLCEIVFLFLTAFVCWSRASQVMIIRSLLPTTTFPSRDHLSASEFFESRNPLHHHFFVPLEQYQVIK